MFYDKWPLDLLIEYAIYVFNMYRPRITINGQKTCLLVHNKRSDDLSIEYSIYNITITINGLVTCLCFQRFNDKWSLDLLIEYMQYIYRPNRNSDVIRQLLAITQFNAITISQIHFQLDMKWRKLLWSGGGGKRQLFRQLFRA